MRRPTRWLLLGGLAAGVAALKPFRVEVRGASMEPGLLEGDWLLATRRGRVRAGDVVVLRHPRKRIDLVKRVVGVPGDRVDGRQLGPDEYLVAGDNRAASTDGREFGTVGRESIEGVVRFRYGPRPGVVR